jgi:hypothetical protein
MKLVAQYKQIEGQDINSVKLPENDDESVELAAQELYKKVLFVEPETVEEMAEEFAVSGKEVSIQAAYARQLEKTTTGINDNKDDKDDKTVKSVKTNVKKADTDVKTEDIKKTAFLVEGMTPAGITAKRQLLEIQLSMTLQVANRMARLDINVDTKGLSETLDVLRQAEREVLKENLANSGVEPVDENADILSETIAGVESLSNADATVLAAPLRGGEFTVRGLNAMADLMSDEVDYNTTETTQAGQNLRRSFETVKRSYEAVETTPRSDMGDSITKAFSNIDELLGELDIDVNYETRRAAKILGYNSMEITQENVDGIISYDREVNRLLDNFYPEAVMGLIKDGINPMDIPIDELNDVISSKNYNNGVTEARNFATYLRDVEKRGEISDDERESYIGLYRVMDKLEKSGDREAGFVFANQANLTIRNMISAMRSRRAKGLDVNIDDSFGMLESLLSSGTGMDEQIEAGFSFGSGLNQEEAPEDIVERYRQTDEDVEWFIQENGIEYNMGNAIAVDALLNEEEGVYKLIYEALSRMKFSDTTEENLVDEETGNMAASMLGEDVDVDISEALDTEQLLRQLGENGDLSLTYEDIRNQLTELMYDAGAAGRITSLDISAIKSATAGVNLLGQMAKNDRYQIPVETGQGTTVVNITLKNAAGNGKVSDTGSDALQATVIEAYTKTEAAGNLTARLELTAYGDDSITVKGEFLSDSSAGNEALNNMQGVEAAFEERLKGVFSGMNISSDVKFGTVAGRENSGVEYTGEAKQPSRGVSCRVAVEAVRTIMELEKSWS